MKKFSQLGIDITSDAHIFKVPKIQITDILNCEVTVLDFEKNVKTKYGDSRHVVKINHNGNECKFFTNAKKIKEALDKINKSDFPFMATIKQESFGTGNGRTYFFE